MAGSAASVAEVLRKLQSVGLCSGLDASEENATEPSAEKTSSLFDGVVIASLEETIGGREARPLPVLLGGGRPVDLLALFRAVRERGGYASVSASCAWAAASEAIGLDSRLGPALKLVYAKYLDALDRCLDKDFDKKAAGDVPDVTEISGESVAEVDGSFLGVSDRKKDYKATPPSGSKKDHFLTPTRDNGRRLVLDDGAGGGGNHDFMVLKQESVNAVGGESPVLKRKRGALVGILNWIVKVAKNPGDPSVRRASAERRKGTGNRFGEVFSQLLLARKALFMDNLPGAKNGVALLQKGQKAHPSYYEDKSGPYTPLSGKLRCSQRINSLNRQSLSGSCSGTSTIHDDAMDENLIAVGEHYCDKRRLGESSLLPDDICNVPHKGWKHIRVGPAFQAEVPGWSPMAAAISSDPDDLKQYGTQIWRPEEKNKIPAGQNSVGNGRQNTCRCKCSGSVECVRFHIAENRLRLKHDLGSAFDVMGFDSMGEEVAISWTEEEEGRFKAVVRLNPPCLRENLWDQLHLSFPLKGRQSLVSYYFNVFLLRRRSYQNRMTPDSIDSDDEDTQFGFLSNPAGDEILKVQEPNSTLCTLNECVDLDSD